MTRHPRAGRTLACLLLSLGALVGCEPAEHVIYGFMDAQGQWVVPPEYDDAYPFSGGLAAVKKGDRWGFVDSQGRQVIEPVFEAAHPFNEGLAAVQTVAGWTFIDTAGETVIPGPFKDALPFQDGLAAIRVDGGWGFVDRRGKLVIEAQFDELGCHRGEDFLPTAPTCFFEGLATARRGDRWGYIDREGRWAIEPRFETAMPFFEGLAAACEPGSDGPCRFGYLDRRGRWAIEPRFLWAMHFSGGRAVALVERNDQPPAPDPAAVGESPATPQTAILIDTAGREIADLDWAPLLEVFETAAGILEALAPDYLAEGLVPATEGDRWGYRDRDGQWRIQPEYAFAMPFRHGLAAVGRSDDPGAEVLDPERWELVDSQGRGIGTERLAMLGGGGGPLFLVQLHSRWGLIDRDGRWRVPPVYAETEYWLDLPIFRPSATEGLYRMGVHANHRWLVADTRGRRLATGEFQWVSELEHPEASAVLRLSVLQNGLWGLADVRLKPVAPARFDRITAGADTLLEVTLEGRVGCVDRGGRWVVPADFDEIETCARDGVRGRRGAEAGTWTRTGGWVPDAAGGEPEATESVYSASTRISDKASWRKKEGESYLLFRGPAGTTGVEPADEVRQVEMRFAGTQTPVQLAVVRRGTAWSVLDEAGRPWLRGSYDGVGKMYDGLVAIQRDGRWGIVDAKGRELFPPREDELRPFTRDVAIFCRGERCGLLSRDGRILLPPTYSSVAPLSRARAEVGIPDPDPASRFVLVGVIDDTGRVIVEPIYRKIEPFSKSLWNATDRRQRPVLLSVATGKPVPGLEALDSFVRSGPFYASPTLSEGLAAVVFNVGNDKMLTGYIDEAGQIVIPPRFDPAGGAEAFQKGAALVTIDGRCGAIDRRGRMIVPAEYDHCYRLSDGKILAGAEAGAPPLEPFLETAPAGPKR